MRKFLPAALLLLLTACQGNDSLITGTWTLQQETTSVGTPLEGAKGTLTLDPAGTYTLKETATSTGQWYLLKHRDTEKRALRLDATEGVFNIYSVDTLTASRMVLRTGFGRRMVYVK
ncbi:MAG: hypothetical protein MUC87_09290 [Bacteroidia bacterium]|jgi:hypothetical protein|nr:hypothetical protein [Bacteroidia bacterium]